MPITEKLASAAGRNDEKLNIELANQIIAKSDRKAIKELVENLQNKSKDIQSDCIKVLYEIGARQPALIAAYTDDFMQLLDSKNNRLQWGAMTALFQLTNERPKEIYSVLAKLASIADKGSVITRDNYVGILTKLCAIKEYSADAFDLLNEQLLGCPSNQLPMYAEIAMLIIPPKNKAAFIKTLSARLDDFEKESKRKRVEKVIRKMQSK